MPIVGVPSSVTNPAHRPSGMTSPICPWLPQPVPRTGSLPSCGTFQNGPYGQIGQRGVDDGRWRRYLAGWRAVDLLVAADEATDRRRLRRRRVLGGQQLETGEDRIECRLVGRRLVGGADVHREHAAVGVDDDVLVAQPTIAVRGPGPDADELALGVGLGGVRAPVDDVGSGLGALRLDSDSDGAERRRFRAGWRRSPGSPMRSGATIGWVSMFVQVGRHGDGDRAGVVDDALEVRGTRAAHDCAGSDVTPATPSAAAQTGSQGPERQLCVACVAPSVVAVGPWVASHKFDTSEESPHP